MNHPLHSGGDEARKKGKANLPLNTNPRGGVKRSERVPQSAKRNKEALSQGNDQIMANEMSS